MGLPGHRRTSSDKRKRAAHFGLKKVQNSVCIICKKPALSHHACVFCGFYNGREVTRGLHKTAGLVKQAPASSRARESARELGAKKAS